MKEQKNETVYCRVEPSVKEQLRRAAQETGRSESALMRFLITATRKPEARFLLGLPIIQTGEKAYGELQTQN